VQVESVQTGLRYHTGRPRAFAQSTMQEPDLEVTACRTIFGRWAPPRHLFTQQRRDKKWKELPIP